MTTKETTKLIAFLSAAYPRQEITDGTLDIYVAMLSKIEYDTAQQAARQHIAESQFFPTIAELLSRAKALGPARTASEAAHVNEADLVRLTPGQLEELRGWVKTIGNDVNDLEDEAPMPGEAWFEQHGQEVVELTRRSVAIDTDAA